MKLKIGVMGSASGPFTKTHLRSAFTLGSCIAENNYITITGACPGYPLEAARGAQSKGGLVVGISPALSEAEHVEKYHSPTKYHDVLIFTGSGLMGREVVNIRSSDIVIIIGGHSGTLGEFAIAYDEGNLIGVLSGTNGIASHLPTIVGYLKKKTGSHIIYDSDPQTLLKKLTDYYFKKHIHHPDVFSRKS